MYGKTNMERAVQMVAILVEIKFGSEWFDVSLQSDLFCLYLALLTVGSTRISALSGLAKKVLYFRNTSV
jgi:hypothetical protein